MKVCFDTNVVLHIVARASDFPSSLVAYDVANVRKFPCLISASAITDIAYLLARCGKPKKQASAILDNLFLMFDIFDVNESDCHQAHVSGMRDFEGAVLAYAAQRNGVEVIVTRNAKDFKDSPLAVMSPEAFVKTFKLPQYSYESIDW